MGVEIKPLKKKYFSYIFSFFLDDNSILIWIVQL